MWTKEEDELFIKLYPNTFNKELEKIFGASASAIKNRANKLGVRKSDRHIKRVKKETCFQADHTPFNKGKQQSEYMTSEQIERTKATRFKKGNTPHNHKLVGYERLTKDGYIEVKTQEPNVFELKHRVLWEKHNGKIPEGCNIQFKDGNRTNIVIKNLYLISREDQMMDNTIHRYPAEVKKSIRLIKKLERVINE